MQSKVIIREGKLVILNITKDSCSKSKNQNDLIPLLRTGSAIKCDGGSEVYIYIYNYIIITFLIKFL